MTADPANTTRSFLDPVLFAHDPPRVREALAAGITGFIVDWETRGKEERQRGAGTEINRDTPEDLARLERLGAPSRLCRVNRMGPWTAREIEAAIAAGATEILLPMVESPEEVEAFLERIGGRCGAGILVETHRAVERSRELAALPIGRVYVGLNDLAISRRSRSLFDAVVDGTVERLRERFAGTPFGFGGLTVADGGAPVPCRLLMAEMVRLKTDFTFLRRSFRRDVAGRDMAEALDGMARLWCSLAARRPDAVESDRAALRRAVAEHWGSSAA